SIRGIWDIAHSTPLELASDVSIPMALLVAAAWAVMFVILGCGVFARRRDAIIPLAAAATASLSLLHSCLDFTLQIPGYSIPFFALFGAGLAQSFRIRKARPDVVQGAVEGAVKGRQARRTIAAEKAVPTHV